MSFGGSRIKSIRSKLQEGVRRWKDRLLPRNSKDTWRGPMPHKCGLKFIPWRGFPSNFFFLLRRSNENRGGWEYVYTLYFLWRRHWWISIPLSSAYFYNRFKATDLLAKFQTNQATLPPSRATSASSLQSFLEGVSVRLNFSPINPRIKFFWDTALRGVGGLSRIKIRFKGKSFKWHRRRGALMLRFGHSHLVALTPHPGIRWRRFGRMKIILFGSNWWDLVDFAQTICWWRPVNVYHGRGIRLRRQTILRKAGKVSAYR